MQIDLRCISFSLCRYIDGAATNAASRMGVLRRQPSTTVRVAGRVKVVPGISCAESLRSGGRKRRGRSGNVNVNKTNDSHH